METMNNRDLLKKYQLSCKNLFLQLRAINNPIALKIIKAIWTEEKYVYQIMHLIGEEQSTTSIHLAQLFNLGLVFKRREHRYVYYWANVRKISELHRLAIQLELFLKTKD